MQLRQVHVVVGLTTLVAFVLTGQYMHWMLDHLRGMPDAPRLLYRSSHIYLMFAGACNLAVGIYLRMLDERRARLLQWIGSAFMIIAPLMLAISFFIESPVPKDGFKRSMAQLGAYLTFGGVLLHSIATWASVRPRA